MSNSVKIDNFLGMVTGSSEYKMNNLRMGLNVVSDEKQGVLTLREPFYIRYQFPTHPMVDNHGFYGAQNFYDKQVVPTGREITCIIQAGVVNPLEDSGEPVVEEYLNTLLFWIRPYYDPVGGRFVDNWLWLNKTIITKVTTGSDATYSNMIKVFGGSGDELGDDSVNKWTIINKSKNQIAQVITSKSDTGNTRICHTMFNSSWEADDVIILMKNYVPLEYLQSMFSVNEEDISFHNILHDIRIGFGGYEKRLGLGIGYRKKYFKLLEFDFAQVHSDITTAALEEFSTIDEIILNPYSFIPQSAYGIDIAVVSGSLEAGKYYFRLTGMLDEYSEVLLIENDIVVDGTKDIEIYPYLRLGEHNRRITHFKVYMSKDGISFNLVKLFRLSGKTINKSEWIVNEDGLLYLKEASPELHTESNAASIDNDADDVGSWERYPGGTNLVVNVNSATPGQGGGGTYYLRCYAISSSIWWGNQLPGMGHPFDGLEKNTDYIIDFYAKADANRTIVIYFIGDNNETTLQPLVQVDITDTWANYQIEVNTGNSWDHPNRLVFSIPNLEEPKELHLDDVSIKKKEGSIITPDTEEGGSIQSEMGYSPSFHIVKSWDQCLVINRTAMYLNPFIEQRWDNFVVKSFISGANASMYDSVIFDNTLELQRFRGDKTLRIERLEGDLLLVLKNTITEVRDPDTGRIIKDFEGKKCIAPKSVVNINGIIFWCSLEDVHAINSNAGLTVIDLMKDSTRDIYKGIIGKKSIWGVRDRYDTYRIRIYELGEKREFLLTSRGWFMQKKAVFPFVYFQGHQYMLWFMDRFGNVYATESVVDVDAPDKTIIRRNILVGEEE